jgi:hypothetical protein
METKALSESDAWTAYRNVHSDRRNLLIHLVTQPLFAAGFAASVLGPFAGHPWWAAAGPLAMLLAIVAQGRGHAFERQAFRGFAGPLDAVRTLLREQLITFPRFVLSGRFARALRAARS